jgi:hypothetical protein
MNSFLQKEAAPSALGVSPQALMADHTEPLYVLGRER